MRPRLQPYSRVDAPYFRSPGFYVRVAGLAAVVGIGLCVLVLRAWSIQVLHGPGYKSLATHQAFRTVDLAGPRSPIVDSHGRLLATTTGHIVIAADVGSLGEFNTHGWFPTKDGNVELQRLAKLAHVPRWKLVTRIRRSVVRSPFAPAVVVDRPTDGLQAFLSERANQYPGIKVEEIPSRAYPLGAFGSEFLGLLGEVNKDQIGTARYKNATAGETVGQSGVEAVYDWLVNPGFVHAKLPVDSEGHIAGPLGRTIVKHLPTLQLSIDARLQNATIKALQDGINDARLTGHHPTGGSAIVMNPYTGAIYALASYPTFNENLAVNNPTYRGKLYTSDPQALLVNRAIAGVYPTGSTFKPIIAEAALQAGIITPDTPQLCSGSFDLGGYVFRNVEAGVYESMTLHTALAQSCDTWFYRLGDRIWAADPARRGQLIQQWARKLGLGSTPPIDVTGASPGLMPSPAWFLKANHFPWTEGQTINLAIGQGALQVSPLQLAVAYSALINGGTVVRPHVAQAVVRGDIVKPLPFPPVRHVKLKDAWAIKQGLYEAAHVGTSAAVFSTFPIPVSGKTGTAEAPPGNDHSWYASWAPSNHPKIVVVAMIEHGGFGAQAAAPAVKEIYEAYFHVKPSAAG